MMRTIRIRIAPEDDLVLHITKPLSEWRATIITLEAGLLDETGKPLPPAVALPRMEEAIKELYALRVGKVEATGPKAKALAENLPDALFDTPGISVETITALSEALMTPTTEEEGDSDEGNSERA